MKLQNIIMCLFLAGIFASCSNKEETPTAFQPNLPGGEHKTISIVHSGNIVDAYDWEFRYTGSRLSSAQGKLYNPQRDEVLYTSQLTYSGNTVSVKNTGNIAMTVILNGENLIETLLVGKDEYNFNYSDGRLIAWTKVIKDPHFGLEASHARATIEYRDGNIAAITYSENNDEPIIYRCTPTAISNYGGLLPETLSKQLGCYGFEHLYYAGLLGKATDNVIKTIAVDYPDEANKEDYNVEFQYSVKNSQIQLCTFILNGEAASVNYTY